MHGLDPIVKDLLGQSPITAVLIIGVWLLYRLLKTHLKSVRAMFTENIEARKHTAAALERNSEVIGENTAMLTQVSQSLKELNRQLDRGKLRPGQS